MSTDHVLTEIHRERIRQDELKREGRFRYTLADNGMDDAEKLACIAEEIGEVGRAILGRKMLVRDGGDLRKELVQVAALAVAWIESLPLVASPPRKRGPKCFNHDTPDCPLCLSWASPLPGETK